MATKSQEILLKGNTTNASAVPSSLKVREIAINALDRSLFTNDGNSIVKLYTGTTKWFDVNGNANNALKADSVAWSGITGKPTTFTPSAHTHTASDVSGLPTSLKNPYAVEIKANGVSLGTYDGSKAATFNLSAANVGAASKVHSHNASEITGLPTTLSAFNNDVGYITGITKAMVEGVLTGNITSHTHSYLPLTGGTLTGILVCDHSFSNSSRYTWRNSRQYSGGGGRADTFIMLQKADGTFNASFGTFGYNETDSYIFVGYDQNYDGLNLRIDATSISWGNNSILHAGNYNSYAPTLTGTGASGTWGINISGNAATATDADTLDGYHADIMVKSYIDNTDNFTRFTNSAFFQTTYISGQGDFCSLVIPTWNSNNTNAYYTTELRFELNSTNPMIRITNPYGTSDWYTLARTVDNVASATKLQTPRTIWGQSFDGSANVDGWFSSTSTDFRIHYNTNTLFLQASSTTLILGEGTTATIPTYVLGKVIHFGSTLGFNAMTITTGGNVLIGTTTDNGYKLDVNGRSHISSDLIVDGEVSALVA